ncbi:hypothetical protein CSA37_01030 [Candidatus Fermentibacteria bacterium]|nr:MAG: hypothetical protein CSA37_01030 [Candidatus Fermentibacteria bacterium]
MESLFNHRQQTPLSYGRGGLSQQGKAKHYTEQQKFNQLFHIDSFPAINAISHLLKTADFPIQTIRILKKYLIFAIPCIRGTAPAYLFRSNLSCTDIMMI